MDEGMIRTALALVSLAGALGAFSGFMLTKAYRLGILIERMQLRMAENSIKIRQMEGYLNRSTDYHKREVASDDIASVVNEAMKNPLL